MIDLEDSVEEMGSHSEEKPNEEVGEDKKEEENGTGCVKVETFEDDGAKQDKGKPEVPKKSKKEFRFRAKSKTKKRDEVLNLNNEVVKMRKEVKRVKALISRKLVRQMSALKKKKGKEAEVNQNQKRAARLLEEIHAFKVLIPDQVTKTALAKNLNFDEVCRNPKATIADRATARIATHPQFKKKIDDIKAAVEAFKEERMRALKRDGEKGKEQSQNGKVKQQLAGPVICKETYEEAEEEEDEVEEEEDEAEEEEDEAEEEEDEVEEKEKEENEESSTVEAREITHMEGDDPLKTKDSIISNAEKTSDLTGHDQRKEVMETKGLGPTLNKNTTVKFTKKPQTKPADNNPPPRAEPRACQTQEDEDSDIESSGDEEKPYFDDSTEERFHKQSSQSEESDSDDFFVGKVSRFKKKKKKTTPVVAEKVEGHETKGESVETQKSPDKFQSELDELEHRLKSKTTKLQSAFCSSLSSSKPGGGREAGRGGNRFRDRGKPRGGDSFHRYIDKQAQFQIHEKGPTRKSGARFGKPCPESEERSDPSAARGRGRGRGDVFRQSNHRGQGAFSRQAPQQVLHPSWEASKRRKEQQGQILAFQGKKIKFDDD